MPAVAAWLTEDVTEVLIVSKKIIWVIFNSAPDLVDPALVVIPRQPYGSDFFPRHGGRFFQLFVLKINADEEYLLIAQIHTRSKAEIAR